MPDPIALPWARRSFGGGFGQGFGGGGSTFQDSYGGGGLLGDVRPFLPSREDVASEVSRQNSENPLGTFGEVLGAVGDFVGHITGAETVKGFIAGAAEGGVGEGFDRAVKSITEWRSTPFAEIRQALGGGDIEGIGAVATDLTGEILLDPLTWLTFGMSAIPKALRSAQFATRGLQREEMIAKGLWHSAAFHVPLGKWLLGKDITIPLAEIPIISPIFKALDLSAAKALDTLGYNTRKAFAPVTRAFSDKPLLPRGPELNTVLTMQDEMRKTQRTIEAGFRENLATMNPEMRKLMLSEPSYQRVFGDLAEIGVSGLDDQAAILHRFENLDSFRAEAKINSKIAKDPEFASRWATLNDAKQVGSDEWLAAFRETYKSDKVPLPANWLQTAGMSPRIGIDTKPFETVDEFIAEANKIHKAHGLPEIPLPAGNEAERAAREADLVNSGASTQGLKSDIRQGRVQEFMDVYADLLKRDAVTPGLKTAFEDWLGSHAKGMQGLYDGEAAAGIVNGFTEHYLARFVTPEARSWIDARMEKAIRDFTSGDQVTMSFMKERKFTDMLGSEVNEFLKHVGTKATNYEALKTTPEEFARLTGQYGSTQAMIYKVFPSAKLRALRKIDPGAVDFFHTNPIYSDYLRTKGSAFVQGVSKAWDAFFHDESPTVLDSTPLTDTKKTTELIAEAAASGGEKRLVYKRPGGVGLENPGNLTQKLADSEIRNRVNLYKGALSDDLAERLMDAKGGYDGVIGQLQASLKLGKDFVVYPATHPQAGAQPVAAKLLAEVSGRAHTASETLDYLRSVRGHMLGEGIPEGSKATLGDVSTEASYYLKKAREQMPSIAEARMSRVEAIEHNLKTLNDQVAQARSLAGEAQDAVTGVGGFGGLATEAEAAAKAQNFQFLDDWTSGTRKALERSLAKAQAGKLPSEMELAVELLGHDVTSATKNWRDLRASEAAGRVHIGETIRDLYGTRDEVMATMRDAGSRTKATLSDFLKNGVNRDIVNNQAALIHGFAKDGIAAFDELPAAIQESLGKGRLAGEVHLVDAASFNEARRWIGELRKPDALRKNPFLNWIANVSDWWKPVTVAHPAFLQSRVRDVTQGMLTLAQQGMVSVGGFMDAGKVTKAVRASMDGGTSLSDSLAGQTIKVMSEGRPIELPLADVVQFAQRRGLIGAGIYNDQLISSANDAAARMLKGSPAKQRGFFKQVGDILGVTSPETSPTLRAGVAFAKKLDDRVRMTGFFSAIRDGMDLETAAAQTRKWTYGLDGPATTFEKALAGNFIPLYSFMKWSVERTADQLVHHPQTVAWINKGRQIAAANPVFGGPGETPEMDSILDTPNGAKFIHEQIGIPWLNTGKGPSYMTLGGLLPLQNFKELTNALGAIFGPNKTPLERSSPIMRYAAGQLNPVWKSALEYMFNTNLYSGRDVERFPGQQSEMFGMAMNSALHNTITNFSRLGNSLDALNIIDVPRFLGGLLGGDVTGIGPDAVPRGTALGGHEQPPFLQRALTGPFGPSPVKTYDINVGEQARSVRFMQERDLMDKLAMLRNRLASGNEPGSAANAQVLSESIKVGLASIARRQELESQFEKPEQVPGRKMQKPMNLGKYYR